MSTDLSKSLAVPRDKPGDDDLFVRAPNPLPRRAALAGGLSAMLARPALAQARTAIKFTCDFRMYGGTAPFWYGSDLGLFQARGVEPTIDGSLGSADAVTRVANGSYDFGCADLGTLAEFASRNPGIAPKMVMPIYDRFPACVVSLGAKRVTTLKELEGIRLGVSTADAGSRILPALLRLRGVDAAKIDFVTIEQRMRDTMLIRRQVDAVVGFDYTVLFNLVGNGIRKEDVQLLYFSEYGFNFYGQGLIVARRHLDGNPELVRNVAIAVAQSWLAAAKNRAAAIASITKRDALADAGVEQERLSWVLDHHVLTPNVQANGIGSMDAARLSEGLKIVTEGFALPSVIPNDQVFDGRFMPPAEFRRVG
jgi:NitT/TauT family transport system substrate-binding protein